jgi:hypothetical protein
MADQSPSGSVEQPKSEEGDTAKRDNIYSALFRLGHSSRLEPRETEISSQNPGQERFLHIDNSTCHKAKKITGKLQKKHITRALHPPHSPDLSPCNFQFFGMVKQKIKYREFCSAQDILRNLSDAWSDLTFEDIQRVFLGWMDRLTWVIMNDGEYLPK